MIIDPRILQQIISNIEHIGASPSISLNLLRKIASSNYSAGELVDIIAQDPTITAQILKIANSVQFAQSEPAKTIKQAVIVLGSSNIKSILFSIEMLGIFRGQGSSKKFNEVDFWRHSVAGAIVASRYAKFDLATTDTDIVYVAALIRNIGVLALRQFVPWEFEAILGRMEHEKVTFAKASQILIGKTHRDIAYMIGSHWNLPQTILDALNPELDTLRTLATEPAEIKKAMLYADDLLQVTKFCVWDPYYEIENIDFHDLPCELIYQEAVSLVDKMFDVG